MDTEKKKINSCRTRGAKGKMKRSVERFGVGLLNTMESEHGLRDDRGFRWPKQAGMENDIS